MRAANHVAAVTWLFPVSFQKSLLLFSRGLGAVEPPRQLPNKDIAGHHVTRGWEGSPDCPMSGQCSSPAMWVAGAFPCHLNKHECALFSLAGSCPQLSHILSTLQTLE